MNPMNVLNNLLHRISCSRKRRQAMRDLHALGERQLKDIGLWRGVIPYTVDQILDREGCSKRGR